MKILLYTGYRTGSNSFGEWASIQLDLPYYHEPFNKNITIPSMIANKLALYKNFLIEEAGDCIIKVSPSDGFDYEELQNLFDKRIVLYRENTKEQAESIMWANEKQLWHHTYLDDKFISAHYTIPMEWLSKNAEEIEFNTASLTKENEVLKTQFLVYDNIENKIEENELKAISDNNSDNILIIGDLHAPFTLPKYLDFCKEQQKKYNCGKVIFIGDIIDNHYSSYHESDPDGMSAGDELDKAIQDIQAYYDAFPKATVIIGNHDRLVYRKAFSGGVSKRWVKEYKDVLKVPNWEFCC